MGLNIGPEVPLDGGFAPNIEAYDAKEEVLELCGSPGGALRSPLEASMADVNPPPMDWG